MSHLGARTHLVIRPIGVLKSTLLSSHRIHL